jgi:hypothetical protein
MKFVIRCKNDHELLWSNDDGWTDSGNHDYFNFYDTVKLNLPVEGQWLLLSREETT